MTQFGVESPDLDPLRRRLREIKDKELDAELKAIHRDLADEVVRRAAPDVPIRSGRLRGSLRASGTVRDAIGRAGKASVRYAPIIHFGWPARGIPARPFLRKAAQEIERDITERYDQQVAAMLNRVIGG